MSKPMPSISRQCKLATRLLGRPALALMTCAMMICGLLATSRAEAIVTPSQMQNHASYALKVHPPVIGTNNTAQNTSATAPGNGYCQYGTCYYWNTMGDDGFAAAGASASLSQPQPVVGANDSHSLAELAVESANQQQIIEIGWIVAPNVNGDSLTHLFVYHWVNNESTCYNGCGFVSTSTSNPAGSLVAVKTLGTYAIQYSNKKWVLTYNGTELGYFPESIWGGTFTKVGMVQAFGEVASSSATKPQTQMGNDSLGTSSKSAYISDFDLINSNSHPTLWYSDVQAPAVYKIGLYNNTCTTSCTMHYGGPGY